MSEESRASQAAILRQLTLFALQVSLAALFRSFEGAFAAQIFWMPSVVGVSVSAYVNFLFVCVQVPRAAPTLRV